MTSASRQRAALAADVGDHAERAAVVASVLHFQVGAGAFVGSVEYRRSLQFGVGEYVGDEDRASGLRRRTSAIRCQLRERDEAGLPGSGSEVRRLKSDPSDFCQLMFVRVADDLAHAGQSRDFFRRALRVTAGDHDPGFGVLAVNAADGGACVLVGRGGHGAGVEDYESGLRRFVGALQAALPQLAFDGSAVRLGGAAAEIHYVEIATFPYNVGDMLEWSATTRDHERADASTNFLGLAARGEE